MPFDAALAQQAPGTSDAQQAPVQQVPSAGTGTSAVSLPEIKVIAAARSVAARCTACTGCRHGNSSYCSCCRF